VRKDMQTHDLKCWKEPYAAVESGSKNFEYRLNDRNYNVGDLLHLNEWDHISKEYTGRSLWREVTYILKSGFGLPENYCIMSLGYVRYKE
jgi:hypothetical protein